MNAIIAVANNNRNSEWENICKSFLDSVNQDSDKTYLGFSYLGKEFPESIKEGNRNKYLSKLYRLEGNLANEFEYYYDIYVRKFKKYMINLSNLIRKVMQYALNTDQVLLVLPEDKIGKQVRKYKYIPIPNAIGIDPIMAEKIKGEYPLAFLAFNLGD